MIIHEIGNLAVVVVWIMNRYDYNTDCGSNCVILAAHPALHYISFDNYLEEIYLFIYPKGESLNISKGFAGYDKTGWVEA